MNSFKRGLGLAMVVAGLLCVTGCSTDNESEAARAKPLGDAGIKPEAGTKNAPPQNQEEWMKRKGDPYAAKGYPGSSKPKAK